MTGTTKMTSKNTDTSGMTDTHTRERESKGEKEFEEALRQEKGEGVEQDKIKAFEWCLKSAEKGHVDAMNNVGWCFSKDKE